MRAHQKASVWRVAPGSFGLHWHKIWEQTLVPDREVQHSDSGIPLNTVLPIEPMIKSWGKWLCWAEASPVFFSFTACWWLLLTRTATLMWNAFGFGRSYYAAFFYCCCFSSDLCPMTEWFRPQLIQRRKAARTREREFVVLVLVLHVFCMPQTHRWVLNMLFQSGVVQHLFTLLLSDSITSN